MVVRWGFVVRATVVSMFGALMLFFVLLAAALG